MTISMSPDQIRSGASGAALAALVDPDWYFGREVGAPAGAGAAGGDPLLDALRHYQNVGAAAGLDPGPFFDTRYYRDQVGATLAEMPDPLDHFVSEGCRAGLRHHPLVHIRADLSAPDLGLDFRRAVAEARVDISPLFDFAHYAASLAAAEADAPGPVSHADLIERYLRGGWSGEGEPHILFDSAFYRAQVRGQTPRSTPLQHYLTVGEGLGLSPHPLFEPVRTRRQIRRRQIETGKADVMTAYAALSSDQTVSTHILFDAEHYLAQIPENQRRAAPALIDYLTVGWREGLDPHPLFSTRHYLDLVGTAGLGGRDPLSHYLTSPDRRDPHYLFMEDFYRRGAGLTDPAVAGLDHYVNEGARLRLQPHPLFQPHYYAAQCERSGFTLVPNIPDLLTHYLQIGHKVPLAPIALFDADYYAETTGLDPVTVDLFRHYLAEGGFRTRSPHPAIDLDHYAVQCPTFRADVDPVMWHLLDQPHGARPTPHHAFDPEHYRASYPDIREFQLCPVLHFLEHGIHEGRTPNSAFSPDYVRRKLNDRTFAGRSVVYEYFRHWKPRLRFVFVSHEASMTGAPGIIARLATELSRLADVECLTILDRPGEREAQFRACSHVHILSKSAAEIGVEHPQHAQEVARVLGVFATRRPDVAFVNSVESRHVGFALNRLDVPIIWLIHELATFYYPDVLPRLYAAAEIVTMPSRFVQDLTRTQIPEPPRKIKVYKQGLLIDDFGTIDREAARTKIVEELEIPANALVVLGCGTLDLRKGIDYFTGVAMTYLDKYDDAERPAYFIWVGDGPRWINTPVYFVEDEIDRANRSDRIRFVGPRKIVEPYFVGADVFLLTSRGDPFPCVVHEAMAARLPVLGFINAGGAPELYEPAGGRSVRLGDVDAMARELALLAGDEAERLRIGEASRQEIVTNWRFQDYVQCYVERIPELTGYTGTLRFVDETAPDILYVAGAWSRAEDVEIAALLAAARPPEAAVGVAFCRGRFTTGEEQPVGSVQGVAVEALQPSADTVAAVVVALEERLRAARPDVMIVRTGNSSSVFSRHLARFAPLVGILHEDDADAIAEAYAEGHNWDLIVARSEAAAAALAAANPAFAGKIVTVPRALVATTGLAVGPRRSRVPGAPAPLVVSAGKFDTVPSKRLAEGALQAILRAMPDCRLHFFVEADEQARFAEIAVRAYGPARVRVDYGWTDDRLLDAIGAADLLLATGETAAANWFVPAAMGQGCVPVVPGKLTGPLATLPALDPTAFRPRRETYATYLNRLDGNLTPERLEAIAGDMAAVMEGEAGRLQAAADLLRDRLVPLALERRPVRRLS